MKEKAKTINNFNIILYKYQPNFFEKVFNP